MSCWKFEEGPRVMTKHLSSEALLFHAPESCTYFLTVQVDCGLVSFDTQCAGILPLHWLPREPPGSSAEGLVTDLGKPSIGGQMEITNKAFCVNWEARNSQMWKKP